MSQPAPKRASRKSYHLGILYAVATAFLLATQEPFSSLGARHLSPANFVCVTQVALLVSVPVLLLRSAARRDFVALFSNFGNSRRLALLFAIGLSGLLLYNLGLSNAHPIIITAILNLSPFWAALVALVVSRIPIPVSPAVFFSCLAAAFVGATIVAWSQMDNSAKPSMSELANNILHSSWIFAIPIPVLYALSGTLIGRWFKQYDESAAVAANFVTSAVILIPGALAISYLHSDSIFASAQRPAILLLMVGTLIGAAAGRVVYQVALTATKNDNGFVTMFFLLIPALASLISLPLSWGLPELRFAAGPLFFCGLALIAAPLLFFSLKSWR